MYKKTIAQEFNFDANAKTLTVWLYNTATGNYSTKTIQGADFTVYLLHEGSGHARTNANDIPAFITGAPSHKYVCTTIENYLHEAATRKTTGSSKDMYMEMRAWHMAGNKGYPTDWK